MISELSLLVSIFLIILTNLLAYGTAQSRCFNNAGNYTDGSIYGSNLDTLLSSLSSNVDDNGFYYASMGQNPDTVYASVLCRGDVQLPTCRTCIQDATTDITTSCPDYKQAVQFREFCTLRYSDEPFFGIMENSVVSYFYNIENASSPDQFMADVRILLDNLRDQAANGGSLRKVAAGNRSSVDFQIVFLLVQCTPDLSREDCGGCLIRSAADIPKFCKNKKGCAFLKPSCNLRYEGSIPFYNETRLEELQALTPPGKNDDSKTRMIIIVVVSIGVCLIAAVCVGVLLIKRAKKEKLKLVEDDISVVEFLRYDFDGIKAATNDFSDANKLGQGGFGDVYKGKLPNGREIAVKRLFMHLGQRDVKFKNEVLMVSKLQHPNLVRLLGFSVEGNERILVYEFVKNTSLDNFIFDPIKSNYLDWEKRYKIIGGISKGLLYLHEESRFKIIHRDLKASNILLDSEMNPKIADFDMARLCAVDETQGHTNRIVGTYGYMSPEYAVHGQFSAKSDVYSLGVLIIEIITGQRNNWFQNEENIEDLLHMAWKSWRQGTIEDIIDPVLRTNLGSMRDIYRCIHIGLLCVQDNPIDRPTMTALILMLTSFTVSLPFPLKPTFFTTSGHDSNVLFQKYDSKEYLFETTSSESKLPLLNRL